MSTNEMMKMNAITKKILSIVLLILLAIGAAAEDDVDEDADVDVTVNAPPYVLDTFEVTINVTEVSDMCSAQFDLIFDPDVINVENVKSDVKSGMVEDDTEIPIYVANRMDDDRIRILIQFDNDIIDEGGVSGSGYIAKIVFEVVGDIGDTSDIDISDEQTRILAHIEPREGFDTIGPTDTSANWFGTNVTIGTAPPTPAETPAPTPTEVPTVAAESAPEPTATPIETPSLELASNPPILTASAQGASAAAVPDTPPENDGLQDLLKAQNFIAIYSLVGLLAFIYTLTLFK